jgi:hypothetical protein
MQCWYIYTKVHGFDSQQYNVIKIFLGGCNRSTKHVNILSQTHYMGDMFRLYHLAILTPHTETYEQNI